MKDGDDRPIAVNHQKYRNPVYRASFPDPFVFKHCGEYFGYCTGFAEGGGVFPVIRSRDLVHWTPAGHAMSQIESAPPLYWAPEVTGHNGKFYLYYSCGNETFMELRVAVSNEPHTGFVDSGHRLTDQQFAIDPHVFIDRDRKRYLFYATDFLEHTHIGTGTVVDELLDWYTLAGRPVPVTRAKYDWQVYDPVRTEKGGVRWHTVEGPAVLKHKSTYFQMFSGGNWKNDSYGVGFAVSDRLDSGDEWEQFADGDATLPVLRTVPGAVIGPGHNSIVVGPNNREIFCVYHSWVDDERVMAIDRMDIAADRMFIIGPTYTPQNAPFEPLDPLIDRETFMLTGDWQRADKVLSSSRSGECVMSMPVGDSGMLLNTNFRFAGTRDDPVFRADFIRGESEVCSAVIRLTDAGCRVEAWSVASGEPATMEIPAADFDVSAFHRLWIELNSDLVTIKLREGEFEVRTRIQNAPDTFRISTSDKSVDLAGTTLTYGYYDTFDVYPDLTRTGWRAIEGTVEPTVTESRLNVNCDNDDAATIVKGAPMLSFEFSAVLRSEKTSGTDAGYGFALIDGDMQVRTAFALVKRESSYFFTAPESDLNSQMPSAFSPTEFRQFRFVKLGPVLQISSEGSVLGEVAVDGREAMIGIICRSGRTLIDSARMIRI